MHAVPFESRWRAMPSVDGAMLLWLGMLAQVAGAQEVPVVLNTGTGRPLVTEVRSLAVPADALDPRLEFDFGFGTAEAAVPGTILDSFTVAVQDVSRRFQALFVTTDASGPVLAPLTPGTLRLDPASVLLAPRAYPDLASGLPHLVAYRVSAAVPSQFVGRDIDVSFDLFDNLDSHASQGWFSDVRLTVVPEPPTGVLSLCALVAAWSASRFKR